jgi:ABC-type oligopeptide transport system substrate-binding subunit
MYALSPSKSIKGSNYGEFLKDKNVLLCTRLYKNAPNLESLNMNKRATKCKSATENSMLKFLTVSSVSSDSIVKGIIDDIIKTAVKTAEVDEQKTKYLQHLQQSSQIKQRYTFHLHPAFIWIKAHRQVCYKIFNFFPRGLSSPSTKKPPYRKILPFPKV